MKFSEILINKNFILCDEFSIDTITTFKDSEVECIYYWYDHLTRGTESFNNILASLNDKDWKKFCLYFENKEKHFCTLPQDIAVFVKNKLLGHLRMNKETIQLLTHSEYECG